MVGLMATGPSLYCSSVLLRYVSTTFYPSLVS